MWLASAASALKNFLTDKHYLWSRHDGALGKLIAMSKVKITLVKSPIDRSKRQKATLVALGFNKMNQTVEHEANPQTMGMIRVVEHLVQVEESK